MANNDLLATQQALRRQKVSQTSQSALRKGGLTERTQRQQTASQLKQVNKNIAVQEINEKIKGTSFTSLADFKRFESSLSPEARAEFQPEVQRVEQEQKKKESEVQRLIAESQSRLEADKKILSKAKQEDDRDREKSYESYVQQETARLSGLQEGLNKLSQGELIPVSSISTYASQKASQRNVELKNIEAIKEAGFSSQWEYIKATSEAEKVLGKPLSQVTTITETQAQQLSIPAQKVLGIKASDIKSSSNEVLINGQGYSVAPSKQQDLISTKGKTISAQNEIILSISPAPTLREQYQTSIKESGPIKGTLSFLGEKTSGAISKSETFGKSGYQEPLGNLGREIITKGPYFTPYGVGIALLIGSGGEDLLTSSGRERLKTQTTSLIEDKGYNPIFAKVLTYGTPVAEVGLGAYGLKVEAGKYFNKPLVTREPIIVDTRLSEPVSVVSKPKVSRSFVNPQGQRVVEETRSVFGIGQVAKEGSKVRIDTRANQFFGSKVKISSKGFEFVPAKPLYSGVPYGNIESYNKALKQLIKSGYTEKQARQVLRFNKPSIKDVKFTGELKVTSIDEGTPLLSVQGVQKTKAGTGKVGDVKLAGSKPEFSLINLEGSQYSTGKGFDIYRFEEKSMKGLLTETGAPYNKLSQIGKTTETKSILSASKNIKEVKGIKGVTNLDDLKVFETATFDVYKQIDIGKKVVPSTKKITTTSSNVFIEQGDPLIRISDETLTSGKNFITGKGAGSKSGSQYFKNLYKTDEGIASIVSPTSKNINIQPTVTPIKPSVIKSSVIPQSAYAGLGQYERTSTTFAPQIVSSPQLNVVIPKIDSSQSTQTKSETLVLQTPATKTSAAESVIFSTKTPTKAKTVPIESIKELQKEKVNLIFKQSTSQPQKVRVPQKTTTKEPVKTIVPVKPPVIIPKASPSKVKKKSDKISSSDIFKAFVKKKGEDIEIGKAGSLAEIKSLLGKKIAGSLRASGFVEKGGVKLKVEELGLLGGRFVKSKKDPFRIVEKRGKRLTKGGADVQEIKMFKKSAKRKSKLGLF